MKKLQILAAVLVLTAGIFSSCKKADNNNNTATATNTYYVTANIVGGNPPTWVATSATGSNSGPLGSGTIEVSGIITSDGESITLTFANSITPGTYQLGAAPGYLTEGYTISASQSGYYGATSGSVTIKSISLTGAVSGSFSFNATDQTNNATVTITNGAFNVKL